MLNALGDHEKYFVLGPNSFRVPLPSYTLPNQCVEQGAAALN